ncbi:MAG: Stp1/IreP family PP2C-type Ser/Thr phosphatase [Oscillospiraceae bacterium]
MQIIGNTDIGCVRKVNQDYYTNRIISQNLGFSIVCDGMGGTGGGEVASKMATEFIVKELDEKINDQTPISEINNIIIEAVVGANTAVHAHSEINSELKGMGTTVVVIVVKDKKIFGVSDGDSRLYKINVANNQITQITNDHTVVQFLLEQGEITREQAENHPQKHYITRAIGVEEYIETDSFESEFTDDDIVLICTDGLYNFMNIDEIKKKTIDSVQVGSVRPLIDLANTNGGGDNITAVVITHRLTGGGY